MTYGNVNLSPGLGHEQKCNGVKPVNGFQPSPLDNTDINKQTQMCRFYSTRKPMTN